MNILLIDSDQMMAAKVADALTEIFNDPHTGVSTSGDLSHALGLIAPPGLGQFALVVCAESVNDSAQGNYPSNGLELMMELRGDGVDSPIIVLSEEERVVDSLITIQRNSPNMEDCLRDAIEDLLLLKQ